MHGVAALVDPELKVSDATHLLPAFDIRAASFCLQYTVPYCRQEPCLCPWWTRAWEPEERPAWQS